MGRSIQTFTLPVLFLATTFLLHAQEKVAPVIRFGPYVELAGALDAASVPVFGGYSECGAFESGSAMVISGGGRVQFPTLLAPSAGLTLDIGGGRSTGTLTTRPADPQKLYESETGALIELDEHYDLAASWWQIDMQMMATFPLANGWAVHGGVIAGYRFDPTFMLTDRIDGPGDYRHADGSRVKPLDGGTTLLPAGLLAGGTAGVSFDIPFGDGSIIQPRGDIGYIGTSPVEARPWSRLLASAGVAWLFGGEPDIVPAADPIPPPTPLLTARLEIIGFDEAGNRLPVPEVFVEERIYRRHAPLLPALFFEQGLSTVSDRYRDSDSVSAGSVSHRIADRSLLALQREIPSIVARRMKQHGSSRLALSGSTSGDENPLLARARAAELKDLLVDVFGIDPERIDESTGNPVLKRSSEATGQGREENRRVELASEDSYLLAPLVLERPERLFDPPAIIVEPRMRADAGIRSWEVTVMQSGREVARFGESGDRPESPEPEFTWRIDDERIDSVLAPIIAVLRVVDSTGAVAIDSVVTPLTVRSRRRVVNADVTQLGERERLEWTLIGFDFNEATPHERDRRMIEEIAALIRPDAEIHVTGTADVVGSEAVNADLALRRANETVRLLRARLAERGVTGFTIATGGMGEEARRFGDEWPEARLLSRGVEIVVEQSVE